MMKGKFDDPPPRSQQTTESGRAGDSDDETTDVMEPTNSQRAAEPVDAAVDPSTRAHVLAISTRDVCGARRTGVRALALILLLWLIIGAIAAGQRHYFSGGTRTAPRSGPSRPPSWPDR